MPVNYPVSKILIASGLRYDLAVETPNMLKNLLPIMLAAI